MPVHLYWRDHSFPDGDGEHANTRRAAFETVEEAYEQAAHDVTLQGVEIAHLTDDTGTDVLDPKKLTARIKAVRKGDA